MNQFPHTMSRIVGAMVLALFGAQGAMADKEIHYNNGGATANAAQFFWDSVNNRVGIGTSSPADTIDLAGGRLTVKGTDTTAGSGGARFTPGVTWREAGRMDIGWGGQGGGNLAVYSAGHASRPGEFNFGFGGNPSIGKMQFNHYDGTNWNAKMLITPTGVSIGDAVVSRSCSDCKLEVNGKIRAKEVVVESGWPDYVFGPDYKRMSLGEIDAFIKQNGHLPGVPSASEVASSGINVGDATKILLEKVEEMTLHMIEIEKENRELRSRLSDISSGTGPH